MTLLLVTHRLRSIVQADRIIVLDGGRIVCEGSHGEIISSCKVYRLLYEAQYAVGEDRKSVHEE